MKACGETGDEGDDFPRGGAAEEEAADLFLSRRALGSIVCSMNSSANSLSRPAYVLSKSDSVGALFEVFVPPPPLCFFLLSEADLDGRSIFDRQWNHFSTNFAPD